MKLKQLVMALFILPVSGAVMAHTGHSDVAGLASGFVHPFGGLDHLVAMLAVGLWAGLTTGRHAWIPVAAFMGFMSLGAVFGMTGIPLPGIEAGIAASLLAMGLLLVSSIRLPIAASAALVGAFAVFHGHAHGAGMPSAATPLLYGLGFILATGTLHLAGIGFSRWVQRFKAEWVLRGAGVLTGGLGAWLLLAA